MRTLEETRFYNVIRRLAEELYRDYDASKKSRLVKIREELYNTYYVVQPLRGGVQDLPVLFVDAGFQVFETDVASLIVVNVGARIRDEEGVLRRVSELSDYPPIETYFIYGRVVEGDYKPEFKLHVVPVDESPLLMSPDLAEKVSQEITSMVNTRLDVQLGDTTLAWLRRREEVVKRFKRLIKYIEGLLEVAYAIKAGDLLARRSVKVVDGTLVRWFGLRHLKTFRFEGLDFLSTLLRTDKEKVVKKIEDVYGLVKTTKFTSIARARSVFRKYDLSDRGLYTNVTEESVKDAAEKLTTLLGSGDIDKNVAEEAINTLIRISHPYTGIWVARFPVTTDNVNVMYFEVHAEKPVLNIINAEVVYDPGMVNKLHHKVELAVNNIAAYRSTNEGFPPYGFMEVDRDVRLKSDMTRKIEDMIINSIREVTKELGHPLELVFSSAWKMRIGYR